MWDDGSWFYLESDNAGSVLEYGGKYIFFSDDFDSLVSLAKEIMENYKLSFAKIPLKKNLSAGEGFGFVLCLYDKSPKLKYTLKNLERNGISYRYWKEVKQGVEFLSILPRDSY